MRANRSQTLQKWARHHRLVMAFAFGMLFALGVWLLQPEPAVAPEPSEVESVPAAPTTTQDTLPAALPTTLRIPTLNLTTNFSEPLGLEENGEVEVPDDYESVGYYRFGPTPGEVGPAVVLGHVDSVDGPAVFYPLGQLEPGDEVLIDRADGTTATFQVTRLERHLQSGFPTEQVYGNLDHAGLRLITCSGTYDKGVARYSHNLVVFAELVDEVAPSNPPRDLEVN